LLAFYINIQQEDRLYYCIHKKGEEHSLNIDPQESEDEAASPVKEKDPVKLK
jgi:hypothetical protein